MNSQVLAGSALIGAIIVMAGMLPQVFHLIRVKDSTGISIWMWILWLIADSLLLIYAISINSLIFAVIHGYYILIGILVIILTLMYRRPVANTTGRAWGLNFRRVIRPHTVDDLSQPPKQ